MKTLFCATGFAAFIIASTVHADTALPVFGKWDCGALVFTLDESSYVFGGDEAAVKSVSKSGENSYVVELTDGFHFGMSAVTKDTLNWFSMESEETYDCKRMPG